MSSLRSFTGSGTLVHWWGTEGGERRGGRRERGKEGEGVERRKEGEERRVKTREEAVDETISTCCSLGSGLDALSVHHHLLPVYCDLGQPFIVRPHTVGEDLGQS